MTTAPATVRDTLAFVRECKRGNDERKLTDRFLDGYLALFIGFYLVAAAAWLLDTDLTTQPFSFLDTVAWLPLLLFGVVWGILHFATWQGPVLSGFGWHLVRVTSKHASRVPKLSEVRQQVENDWRAATAKARRDEGYAILRDAYEVEIER